MKAQTYYHGDPEEGEPDLPAAVLMEPDEAERLRDALADAHGLMAWALSLPQANAATRATVETHLRTLGAFYRAHCEAHELRAGLKL